MGKERIFFSNSLGKFLFAAIFVVAALFSANLAEAAVRTSTATGGLWTAGTTWVGGVAPANADSVIIATTGGNSVNIGANTTNGGVTVNSGAILTFNGAFTLTVGTTGNVTVNGTINGATGIVKTNLNPSVIGGSGTINSKVLIQRPTTISSTANITFTAITTIANTLTIASGGTLTAVEIDSNAKTVANNGTVNLSGNYLRTGGTSVWTQGTNAVVNIGGAFTPAANITLNASAAGNTVNYNGGAQTPDVAAYANLTLSGSGSKTITSGISVAGTLSIAPTGTATANIGAGLNISANALRTGGVGTINGTWGSTSSAATNQENASFDATTGIVTVATDTRGAQATLTAVSTPSSVTYGTTSTLSTTGGNGTGAVAFSAGASTGCSLAGTVLSVTNASGTCSITATKAADKHYLSATSAALTVPLLKATQATLTAIATPSTVQYGTTSTLSSSGGSGTGAVTFSVGASTGCSVAGNTLSVIDINGTCNVTATKAADNNYNQATSAALSVALSSGVTTQFLLNHPGTTFAKTRVGYTVTRKDSFGNVNTSGTSAVYLYTNSTGATHVFYADNISNTPITSVEIANGQSLASFYYYDDTAATVTITASDATPIADGATGITDGTDSLVVQPVATKFVIIQPSNGTVDAPISVTVQAQKPDNSVDTNYQTDVTLGLTGSATSTGGGLVNIINGVGTINISDTVAETAMLSLSDSQSTGLDITSTKQVTFAAGALAQYSLSHPGSIGAGTRAAYTVTRKDQYGNLVTSGGNTVYLYSNSSSTNKRFYDAASAGTVLTSVLIANGQSVANFWYYDDTLGNWTITASDNASAPNGNTGVIDASDSLAVVPGAVATFTLNHPGTITVGTRAAYTVTRKDAFGNLVTVGSTNIYLYSASFSTSTAFYLASSGGSPTALITVNDTFSSANFWYEDGVAGTYTITGSDSTPTADGGTGIADGTDSLVVSPAPIVATRLVIQDPPAATTDAAVTITVKAEDGSDNVQTTFNGTVTLNTTGSAAGGGVVTITNGVGTKDLTDTVAQSVNLTLTDTGGTGLNVSSAKTVTFSPGALAQFSITSPGDVAAGSRLALTVSRKDAAGNGVTSGLTTVYLYSASANVNKRFYNASSGGSAITFFNFTAGVSSTQVWYYDETAATTTVTISDNATSSDGLAGLADGSTFVHVIPAVAHEFILSNPGSMFVGTRAPYTVTRKDQFGNLVTSGIDLAYLWSSSTGANKKFYDAATSGNIITSAAIDDGRSTANFWYYDDVAGTWTITVSNNSGGPSGTGGFVVGTDNITVSTVPIVATRIVILSAGPSQVGNTVLVTIQAQDNSDNIQTDYNNSVTLNVTGSATGGGVITITNGTGVASVNDFTAETVTLSLTDSNATGLDTSSVQNLTFTTAPVLQPGFSGGGSGASANVPVVGGVTFGGRAYPGAKISIVALGETATVLKQATVASASGIFQIDFRGISIGARSYGLLVQDKDGRIAQSRVFDVNLVNASDIIQVGNILVSPTIGFSRSTVTKGDRLIIVGYSSPNSIVSFKVDGSNIIERAQVGAAGTYRVLIRTGDMSLGSHTIIATQSISGRSSDPSIQKVFNVSNLLMPQVDFNSDGKVNITDASIFLFRFNSTNQAVKLLDDLNNDGKVDVTDFSIFLKTLRLQF